MTAPSESEPLPPLRASGMLPVGDGHEIYWEESGTPDGIPLLYLHGGPGGSLGAGGYRRHADPSVYRVIGFEQRGCGRSTPHTTAPGYDLARNTTPHLVADIEALRAHLGVDRAMVLVGVSWGSTLALAYATEHPEAVRGICLFAVTSTSRAEVDWITETCGALYPAAWDAFADAAERTGIGYRRGPRIGTSAPGQRIVEAYARLLDDPDERLRLRAARAWTTWEDHHVAIGRGSYRPNPRWDDPEFRVNFARLVTHYWSHDGFLDPPILDRMASIQMIPAVLIHGRLDVSGPAVTPWELHRRWPASRLVVIEGEGHGGPRMGGEWDQALRYLAGRTPYDRLPQGEYVFPGPERDLLVGSIVTGRKTATASLVADFEAAEEALPQVGDREVVVDSAGHGVVVTENTAVRVVPLAEVDDAHALAEGEEYDDAAGWRAAHERFWQSDEFRASIGRPDFAVDDATQVVCVEFRVIARL